MGDRIKEALLVLEHHRALFRLKHARTEGERYRYIQEVRLAEEHLKAYEEGLNDKRVQGNEKVNNSGEARPTLCVLWKKDNARK